MNNMVKVVKGTGKVTQSSIGINIPVSRPGIGSGVALNQKLRVKNHVTETALSISKFLDEAQAELENLLT